MTLGEITNAEQAVRRTQALTSALMPTPPLSVYAVALNPART
jgi:hypothetical protein